MTGALTKTTQNAIATVGAEADKAAAAHVFIDYTSRKADNTLRAQANDLATFAEFMTQATKRVYEADALQTTPAAWTGLTWGLVEAFVKWMLNKGYAIGTVNRKLSTVKVYAKLAGKAGAIDAEQAQLIRAVGGYSVKEGKRVDERRPKTRKGHKAAAHVVITRDDAERLKNGLDDTPQGIRDDLMMSFLLDHGLRLGELAGLRVEDINMAEGKFTFNRPKVDKVQTHRLSRDTLDALREYFDGGHAPSAGPLLRTSRRGGHLTDGRMSERAITKRVKALGEALGIDGLSAHDCRHYWATRAAECGTDAFALRDAGGWNSLAMPGRYVEAAEVANERVKLN